MEETNQQTSGDFDLITKDRDGNVPAEDEIDNGSKSQSLRKNSGEMDFVDGEVVSNPITVSSNGIDNENTSELCMNITEASNDTLNEENVIGSVKDQTDKTNDGENFEMTVTDKEGDLKVNENVGDIKSPGWKKSENFNNSDERNSEKLDDAVSKTGEDEENILHESSSVNDNDKAKLNSDGVKVDGNEPSEKENEFCEVYSMPYGEKDVCVNDLIKSDSCNKIDESMDKTLSENERLSDDVSSISVKDTDEVLDNRVNDPVKENVGNLNEFFPDNTENNSANDGRVQEDGLSSRPSSSCKETDEIEMEITESQRKDGIQLKNDCTPDGKSTFSPINNFSSQIDELELAKNDMKNDGNEILTTEMVNCNDESQMELSEQEKESEVNNIEPDVCEDLDKKQDDADMEEMDVDKSCESDKDSERKDENNSMKDQDMSEESEMEKQISSVDESEAFQPGGSEEETITGDTSSEVQINDSRGKDAEICIIPDDVAPRLPTANKEKIVEGDGKGDDVEGTVKILEVGRDGEKKEDRLDDGNEKTRTVEDKKSEVQQGGSTAGSSDSESGSGQMARNEEKNCAQCGQVKSCKFEVMQGGRSNLCSEECYNAFVKTVQPEVMDAEANFQTRKCSQCHVQVAEDENMLSWETMDFCNEECLGKYQTEMGSHCANCKRSVASASLGKYCVRFGYDVKQFCTSACLEEYKKGLKVCSYCQKDMSTGTEGFLAPVGDKGHFKDFCTQSCMEKYEQMSSSTPSPSVITECAVCSNSKPVKLEVQLENKVQKLCSEPCFAAFKFVNNITEGQCDMCKKYFDRLKTVNYTIYYDDSPHTFCGKTCMNVYILANRKIVPCNWCKVKKYNFDMIKKVCVTGQVLMMCSLNCLALYQVSINAVTSRRIRCDFCTNFASPKYHLTMSDTSVRNFCSYTCVMSFQNQYPKQTLSLPATDRLTTPIPTGGPKKILPRRSQVGTTGVPVISSVQSLASPNGTVAATRVSIPASEVSLVPQVASISQPITIQQTAMPTPPPPQVYQQIITKPAPAKQQKNKSVLCKPYSHTKGVSCRPHPCMKETQTDESLNRKFLIPVPVPIYVPAPMHMFATPFPVAVPFPLPIPVPIFIPTTRNSAKGIFKEIKRIQEKIPTDPFEAELLMMAEMVAGEKKQDPTDSESEDGNDGDDGGDGTFSPENVDTSNTFGDDMLQMALKMATELEEPPVDMESVLTSNTITPTSQPSVDPSKGLYGFNADDPDQVQVMPMNRGRKRAMRGGRSSSGGNQSKRGRRISGSNVDVPILPPPEPVPPPRIEVEKPDANFCLKYTFGVNAWRHWVMQKNAELEKAALTNRKIKLFKPELLQLTADELNFSLCLFVKEVRKPNGTEYAPDTIYYLCLGIQQYLFENGRIDNIFTDSYYEKFTDCLDEVAKKFAALYSDSQYIVTRVEEEHLWESKQLGAHSPHVLLSTLMFFNTKHFNLVTVEEHMQLSFSHIMKHWKRNPNSPGVAKVPGSRNVLLRFYPPQSALEANSRKKKVYEQQENEENPLRCPVKLYEFYLSKCPESVKTRNDVFYLLPERSCVPDSPVWYSTMALGKEPLTKMLHRVKMVKEINIALLSC